MMICSFFGHRSIPETEDLRKALSGIIGNLIEKGVTVFLFGSRSAFNDLCLALACAPLRHQAKKADPSDPARPAGAGITVKPAVIKKTS